MGTYSRFSFFLSFLQLYFSIIPKDLHLACRDSIAFSLFVLAFFSLFFFFCACSSLIASCLVFFSSFFLYYLSVYGELSFLTPRTLSISIYLRSCKY
ncbi:hypothetical protein DFP73DRAFT_376935 [Morchella snyderi]|nr:hypothetical protein DFP73DRAFT_376935 [Morchella snyderi]